MKNLEFSMKELRLSLSLSLPRFANLRPFLASFAPGVVSTKPLPLASPLYGCTLHGCTGLFSQSPLFSLSLSRRRGRVGDPEKRRIVRNKLGFSRETLPSPQPLRFPMTPYARGAR